LSFPWAHRVVPAAAKMVECRWLKLWLLGQFEFIMELLEAIFDTASLWGCTSKITQGRAERGEKVDVPTAECAD